MRFRSVTKAITTDGTTNMGDNFNEAYEVEPRTLHENAHYTVHVVTAVVPDVYIVDSTGCAYDKGYALVSKGTGVIELIRTSLPDALWNAEHLSKILTEKPYLWLEKIETDDEKQDGFDFSDLN